MGRKRHGTDVKQAVSVKIEPCIFIKIIKKYGSFSKFVNEAIRLLILGE